MPHPSKRKGDRGERMVVQAARDAGLEAVRARGSDGRSLGEAETVDVIAGGARIQVKTRRGVAGVPAAASRSGRDGLGALPGGLQAATARGRADERVPGAPAARWGVERVTDYHCRRCARRITIFEAAYNVKCVDCGAYMVPGMGRRTRHVASMRVRVFLEPAEPPEERGVGAARDR